MSLSDSLVCFIEGKKGGSRCVCISIPRYVFFLFIFLLITSKCSFFLFRYPQTNLDHHTPPFAHPPTDFDHQPPPSTHSHHPPQVFGHWDRDDKLNEMVQYLEWILNLNFCSEFAQICSGLSWWSKDMFFSRVNDVPIFPCT